MKKVARGLESRLSVQHSTSHSLRTPIVNRQILPSIGSLFLEMLISKEELLLLALMIYHHHHLLDISDLIFQHGMWLDLCSSITLGTFGLYRKIAIRDEEAISEESQAITLISAQGLLGPEAPGYQEVRDDKTSINLIKLTWPYSLALPKRSLLAR